MTILFYFLNWDGFRKFWDEVLQRSRAKRPDCLYGSRFWITSCFVALSHSRCRDEISCRGFFFFFFFCCIPSLLLPTKLVDCAGKRCGSDSRAGLWRNAAIFLLLCYGGRKICLFLSWIKAQVYDSSVFWSVYYGHATVERKRGDAKKFSLLSTRILCNTLCLLDAVFNVFFSLVFI